MSLEWLRAPAQGEDTRDKVTSAGSASVCLVSSQLQSQCTSHPLADTQAQSMAMQTWHSLHLSQWVTLPRQQVLCQPCGGCQVPLHQPYPRPQSVR